MAQCIAVTAKGEQCSREQGLSAICWRGFCSQHVEVALKVSRRGGDWTSIVAHRNKTVS